MKAQLWLRLIELVNKNYLSLICKMFVFIIGHHNRCLINFCDVLQEQFVQNHPRQILLGGICELRDLLLRFLALYVIFLKLCFYLISDISFLGYLNIDNNLCPAACMWLESFFSLLMAIGYITTALVAQPYLSNLHSVNSGWNKINENSWGYSCVLASFSLFSGMWFILHSIHLSLNFTYVRTAKMLRVSI